MYKQTLKIDTNVDIHFFSHVLLKLILYLQISNFHLGGFFIRNSKVFLCICNKNLIKQSYFILIRHFLTVRHIPIKRIMGFILISTFSEALIFFLSLNSATKVRAFISKHFHYYFFSFHIHILQTETKPLKTFLLQVEKNLLEACLARKVQNRPLFIKLMAKK